MEMAYGGVGKHRGKEGSSTSLLYLWQQLHNLTRGRKETAANTAPLMVIAIARNASAAFIGLLV